MRSGPRPSAPAGTAGRGAGVVGGAESIQGQVASKPHVAGRWAPCLQRQAGLSKSIHSSITRVPQKGYIPGAHKPGEAQLGAGV